MHFIYCHSKCYDDMINCIINITSIQAVLYTNNVCGFSWDNTVRILCLLFAFDIMSVIISYHANMFANFKKDLKHFLCSGQKLTLYYLCGCFFCTYKKNDLFYLVVPLF